MKRILMGIFLVFFCTAISLAEDGDLKKIDGNSDGKISNKEYLDAVIKTFNKIDKNTDGFLSSRELKEIIKSNAEKFVQTEDMNKDGRISREEFTKAAQKRFRLLDKNNDGFIDQKEWNDIKENVNQKNAKIPPVAPFIIFKF